MNHPGQHDDQSETVPTVRSSFPYVGVADTDIAFGLDPETVDDLVQRCPATVDEKWQKLAQRFFSGGAECCREQMDSIGFQEKDVAVLQQQAKVLQAIGITFRFQHEDKMRVMGWLLSDMLNDFESA